MSVSYRKKGNRWHIRFRQGSGKNRREVVKTFNIGLHEDSIRKKADWYEIEWQMGRYDPFEDQRKNAAPLLGEAVTEHCEENLLSGNWKKGSTYKGNKNVLTRMFAYVWDVQLGERTDREFFQHYFNQSAGNARTKKSNVSRVNPFLKWAHEKGYLPERYKVVLPVRERIEVENKKDVKYITWEQVRDLCAAHRWLYGQNHRLFGTHSRKPADFYPDLWWFMFYSLLRKEEVPKLQVKDLLPRGRLRVYGKGRGDRTDIIHLPPPALTLAEKYAYGKKADDRLFISNMNRPKHHLKEAIRLALGPEHAEEHGGTGFHQFRHGGVVHYLSLGKPMQFISKLARHRSIRITDEVYGDVIDSAMQQVFSDITHAPATSQRRAITKQNLPGLN